MIYTPDISTESKTAIDEQLALFNPDFTPPANNNDMTGSITYAMGNGSVGQLHEYGNYMINIGSLTGAFTIERIKMNGAIPTYKNPCFDTPAHSDLLYTTPQRFEDVTSALVWLNSDFVTEQALTGRFLQVGTWLFYTNPEHFRQITDGVSILSTQEYDENEYNNDQYQ